MSQSVANTIAEDEEYDDDMYTVESAILYGTLNQDAFTRKGRKRARVITGEENAGKGRKRLNAFNKEQAERFQVYICKVGGGGWLVG